MSDAGHKETDRALAKLEKKLRKTYSDAEKSAQKKFDSYMQDFARKDVAHKADVATGRWTEKQYKDWRRNQILYSKKLAEMRDVLAKDFKNVDKIAVNMMRDHQADVYAINHNYATFEIESGLGIDTSYTLYDHDTVERMMLEDPAVLPAPSPRRQAIIDAKDLAWNKQHIQSALVAGILSGDSIPDIAKRLMAVTTMDYNAAIRNARTMTTSAECGGRIDGYKRAKAMGIDLRQEWMATLDSRTRDSHRMLDGEIVNVGEKFSNGLRFPGDPDGPAAEVYNCRCTIVAVVDGIDPGAFDKTDTLRRKLGNSTINYDDWKRGHGAPARIRRRSA